MKSIIVGLMVASGLIVSGSALATDMPIIAKKNGCTACHAIDKKVVGPSWQDVANKYKDAKTFSFGGKDYPVEEGLMMKVSKGGSGNWGSIPMIGNDPSGAKQPVIKELVEFIRGLAN